MTTSFDIQHVLAHGILNPDHQDTLIVDWKLVEGCNYACSYCHLENPRVQESFSSEQLLTTARHILELGRPHYLFRLYGGEPTIHPFFPDLLHYLRGSGQSLSIEVNTNASRSLDYFRHLSSLVVPSTLHLQLSVHPEYISFSHLEEVLTFLVKAGHSCEVDLVFLPTHKARCRDYYAQLCSLRVQYAFHLSCSFLYQGEALSTLDPEYTKEDIQWARQASESFKHAARQSGLNSPDLEEYKKVYYQLRCGEEVRMIPDESEIDFPERFTDFYCCAGANFLHIEPDGTFRGGDCSAIAAQSGKIYQEKLDYTTLPHLVRCKGNCNGASCAVLPKFRQAAEAEKCLKEYKERAIGLRQAVHLVPKPFSPEPTPEQRILARFKRLETIQTLKSPLESSLVKRRLLEDRLKDITIIYDTLADTESRTVFLRLLKTITTGDSRYLGLSLYPRFEHPLVKPGAENEVLSIHSFEMPIQPLPNTPSFLRIEVVKQENDFFDALECLLNDYHPNIELALPSEPDIWLEIALRFIRNHPEYTLYMGQHDPEIPLPCLYARPSARFLRNVSIPEGSIVPSVSVIVSSSEDETSLRRCLDSLLLQDIPDFEIIVVHRKGTEKTDNLVKTYSYRYPSLLRHVAVSEQITPEEAWNKGINIALGKACVFITDKEEVTVGFLKRCLECLKTEEADIVACCTVTHFTDGKEEQEVLQPGVWNGVQSLRHLLLEDAGSVLSSARMYRATFVRERNIQHDDRIPLSFAVQAFYHSRKTITLPDMPGIIHFEDSNETRSSENNLHAFFRQSDFLTSFFSAHGLLVDDFALEQYLQRYYQQIRTALSSPVSDGNVQAAFATDQEALSFLGRSPFALRLFLVDYALLYCRQKNLRPYVLPENRDWQANAVLTKKHGNCIAYGEADAPRKGIPLLSVIMPNYNKAQYLKQSLNSILSQSMPDFECIIIDDASTDESMELLQDYADLHDCIRLYQMSVNSRQGMCRNIGMEKAKGQFLIFIDSDDTIEPDFFRTAVQTIQEEQADMVVFATQHIDKNGTVTWSRVSEEGRTSGNEAVEALFKGTIGPEPWGKIFDTSFLKEKGIRFPEHVYHQDEPFLERALRNSRIVALRREVVYRNLLSEGSVLRPHSQTYLHAHSACVYYAFLQHIADSEQISPAALAGVKEHLIWNLEHIFLPTCAAFWETARTLPLTTEDVALLCRSPLFIQALLAGCIGYLSQNALPKGLLPAFPLPERSAFRQSSDQPLISAILPVQNQEKNIVACLENIRQQNFFAFEVLVVDDASTDGTPALCRLQAMQDSRIFLTAKATSEGTAVACSSGMEMARGKYITFLSASDTLLSHFFLHGVMLLERHPELDAIIYAPCFEEEQNERVYTGSDWLEILSQTSNEDAWKLGGKIFRRELLEQSQILFSDPCVENVFLWSVYARARRVLLCPKDEFGPTASTPMSSTVSVFRPNAESFCALIRLARESSSLLCQKNASDFKHKDSLLHRLSLLLKKHLVFFASCNNLSSSPLDEACLNHLASVPQLVQLILEECASLYVQRTERAFQLAIDEQDFLQDRAYAQSHLVPLVFYPLAETKKAIHLSIILLVTDADSTLSRCLDSILDQIEPGMEILLLEQSTSDTILELCQQYAQQNECIRLFRLIPKTDMGKARQLALQEAAGTHLLFVKANSWLAPDYLNTASRLIENDPVCDAFFFSHQEWDPTRNCVVRYQVRPEAILNALDAVRLYIEEGAHGKIKGSQIYRRAFLIEKQVSFTAAGVEDNLFLLQTCMKGSRFHTTSCIAINVMETNDSCSEDSVCLSQNDFNDVVILLRHTKQLFASPTLAEEVACLASECLHTYAQGTCGSTVLGFIHLCMTKHYPSPLKEDVINALSGSFLKALLYRSAVLSVTPLTPTVLPPQPTQALSCSQKNKEINLSVVQDAPAGTPPAAIAMLKGENLVDPELWATNPRDALILMLRRSGFFDCAYYWRMYPDIADVKLDPIEHYVDYGAAEKWRDPAPWFDTSFYLEENPDVRREGINPFYHYLIHGYHEQRRPNKACQKKNSQPKVSVIVPVYNNAQYLHECIDSIVNQTLQEIEIICIDDGSTDKSSEILDEYARKDPRVKVIHKKNTGYGHSMNVGLDAATGEYIGIVESDDYILPEMYDTLYQTAKKYDVDFVKSDFKRFYGDKKNRIFEDRFLTEDKSIYGKILNPQENLSLFHLNNVIWNGIYSYRFIFNNNIRFNETPGASYQDNGFWFQIFMWAKKIYCIKNNLYMLRRDNPNSSVLSKVKVFCMCDEYKFIRDILNKNSSLEKKLIKIFNLKKFHNYMFTYNRIGDEYKLLFLKRFSEEFYESYKKKELDKEIFGKNWDIVSKIIDDYNSYFLERVQKKQPHLNSEIKKGYIYYNNLNPNLYPQELKEWYKKQTGKELNLDNPQTYNEKIQWLKLYDSTSLKTRLADKYLVREWVKEKIGEEYLIPLLGVWDYFEDINFDKLPNKFVLKANHGCGWNIIVKDKNKFDKKEAKAKFDKWMNTNFAFVNGFELHYKDIKPKIIAEEYIESKNGDLYDYKVFCFNGKPHYILIVWNRINSSKATRAFFDTYWNIQGFTFDCPLQEHVEFKKPENLQDLLSISSKLSAGFCHARIDFYKLDNEKIKFGEITFTSTSGICKWNPEKYDRILGDYLILPKAKPKVSVIIPIYNSEKYLKQCLDSIINQSLKDIEIICVNDGSNDSSLKILENYSQRDSRITIIDQNRSGGGAARNKGLEIARGEYISFLDSDDFFELNLLEEAYNKCKKDNADIGIYKVYKYDNITKKDEFAHWAFVKEQLPSKIPFSYKDIPDYIFNTFQNWPWNKMFKKTFIDNNNLKFQKLLKTNDLLFTCSALILAQKITLIDKILVHYRTNTGISTQQTNDESPFDFYIAFLELKNFLIKNGCYNNVERSFLNSALNGSIYNLKSLKNYSSFVLLYKKIKEEIIFKLGFDKKNEAYFYNKKNYLELLIIQENSVDKYIIKKKILF